MNDKYLLRRGIAITLSAVTLLSTLSGCAVLDKFKKDEAADAIANGQNLPMQNIVSGWTEDHERLLGEWDWVQLDQLDTYVRSGFRTEFDRLLYINTVTTKSGDTKQGCIYNINLDGTDIQYGNATMRDAFRNEVFMEYWNDNKVRSDIASIINDAYEDVDPQSATAAIAALNAYFNIMQDESEDETYDADRIMSREQLYTMVYRAGYPVKVFDNIDFELAIKGMTYEDDYYAPFVAEIMQNGYLDVFNGSLNAENIDKPITKLEALYLVVNTYFKDQVKPVSELTGKESVFGVKNGGDIIGAIGITGSTASKAHQHNLLSYMMANSAEKGIDQTLVPYMQVAQKLGLHEGFSGGIFSPINKHEAMQMLINTYKAENKVYGYLTTDDYGVLDALKWFDKNRDGYTDINEDLLSLMDSIYLPLFDGIIDDFLADVENTEDDPTVDIVVTEESIVDTPVDGETETPAEGDGETETPADGDMTTNNPIDGENPTDIPVEPEIPTEPEKTERPKGRVPTPENPSAAILRVFADLVQPYIDRDDLPPDAVESYLYHRYGLVINMNNLDELEANENFTSDYYVDETEEPIATEGNQSENTETAVTDETNSEEVVDESATTSDTTSENQG